MKIRPSSKYKKVKVKSRIKTIGLEWWETYHHLLIDAQLDLNLNSLKLRLHRVYKQELKLH